MTSQCWRAALLAAALLAGCAVPTLANTESPDNLVVFGPGETAAFDRDVMGGKLVWVVAVVDHSRRESKQFTSGYMSDLASLTKGQAKVAIIDPAFCVPPATAALDLPTDMAKPSVHDLQLSSPSLWLIHRNARTVRALPMVMDPDGQWRAFSILSKINRLLERNRVAGGGEAKLRLGLRDEL